LTVASCVVSALLKSESCANKFVGILDRVGMELQGKFDSFVRIKAELLKRLQLV